mmetsp:Transcript_14377/g.40662  ORF Transcript_14377/g.40662 Transcript_14377/m.40662 type:complete len:798 (+) Transcript_14377:40-2433(+)
MSAAMKLAVSGSTTRLAVYKCLVAAELAGVKLTAAPAAQAGLTLRLTQPALVSGSLQLFGEHAICRFLGSSSKKERLEDSLAGFDWIEFTDKLPSDAKAAAAAVEDRLAKKADPAAKYLGDTAQLGFADVCVGCTLALARASGVELGPVSAKWLASLEAAHGAFASCLIKSDAIVNEFGFSFLAARHTQKASFNKILAEATAVALAKVAPGVNVSPAVGIAASGKKGGKGPSADLQVNNAMSLYKELKDESIKSPRDVAVKLQAALEEQDLFSGEAKMFEKTEIAGPGFINCFLAESFVAERIRRILEDGELKPPQTRACKVGIDFSSPNAAKEMHVGHLRSTIIGEVIARMLEFCGNKVDRINHIGDWGTQFGMLLTYMRHNHPDYLNNPPSIKDLDAFYREAKKAFDGSDEFKEEARLEVVKLQAGDEQAVAGWKQFLGISEKMLFAVYERLNVSFPDGLCGESFYNSRIPAVVEELTQRGFIKDEDGAKCIFTDVFEVPLFAVKRDGGYGYDSTDLTALKYRTSELKHERIIYVVDLGQENHFRACFEVAQRAGWTDNTDLHYVGFGVVQGKDRKRFRTREGGTVRLVDLLDEARNRMHADLEKRLAEGRTPLTESEIEHAANNLGYSAVKYFDLKNSRDRDYVFDYDAMLASDGDTAVYLIYSYARICSIERKIASELGVNIEEVVARGAKGLKLSRDRPLEWQLAIQLVQFPDALERALADLKPHYLCTYVYDLAVQLSRFYSEHRLIVANEDGCKGLDKEHGEHWLALIHAVRIALRDAFKLVAIEPLERV